MKIRRITQDESIACHNPVHFGPEEAFESLRRSIDDRFVFVEAGIQEHRNAGEFFEFLDQPVIKWILRSVYGLQASRAIDVRDRRQKVSFIVSDRKDLLHERVTRGIDKILVDSFFQDRRSEGTEFFAKFDFRVDELAHVRAAGIRQDAAISKGPGAPFHSSLKPSDDVAIGQQARRGPAGLVTVVETMDLELALMPIFTEIGRDI